MRFSFLVTFAYSCNLLKKKTFSPLAEKAIFCLVLKLISLCISSRKFFIFFIFVCFILIWHFFILEKNNKFYSFSLFGNCVTAFFVDIKIRLIVPSNDCFDKRLKRGHSLNQINYLFLTVCFELRCCRIEMYWSNL